MKRTARGVKRTKAATKKKRRPIRKETLTEAYEVKAFRDEMDESSWFEPGLTEIAHAAPGAFQTVKEAIKGHGEQTVLPDDCQFGDNDMCYVEA